MGKFWHRSSRSRSRSRSPARNHSRSPNRRREAGLPEEWLRKNREKEEKDKREERSRRGSPRRRTSSKRERIKSRRRGSRSRSHSKRSRRRRESGRGTTRRGRSRSSSRSSRSSVDLDAIPHVKKAVELRRKYGLELRPNTSLLGGLIQDIRKFNNTADFAQTESAQKLFKKVDPAAANRKKVMLMSEFLSTKALEIDDGDSLRKDNGSRSPSPVARNGESYDEFKERKAREKKERARKLEEKKYRKQQEIAQSLLGKKWGSDAVNSSLNALQTTNSTNTLSSSSSKAQGTSGVRPIQKLPTYDSWRQTQSPAQTLQATNNLSSNQWALGGVAVVSQQPLPPLRPPPITPSSSISNQWGHAAAAAAAAAAAGSYGHHLAHPPVFPPSTHTAEGALLVAEVPMIPGQAYQQQRQNEMIVPSSRPSHNAHLRLQTFPGVSGDPPPPGTHSVPVETNELKQHCNQQQQQTSYSNEKVIPLPPLPPEAFRIAAAAAAAQEKEPVGCEQSKDECTEKKVDMFDAILNNDGEDEDEEEEDNDHDHDE